MFKARSGTATGPDQRAVWREMARLLDGELVEGRRPTADTVVVRHGAWSVVLDIHVQHHGQYAALYTRVQAYFPGWRGLSLLIRRRNVFDRLWEAMGFGSRLPVSPALLERYVVKGKPEGRVPSLLTHPGLHQAIQAAESVRLEVRRPGRKIRKRYREDTGEVVCRASGVVRDLNRLAGLIRTVVETLDALHRVGEARAEELSQIHR